MSIAPEWFDELASHYVESRENLDRICVDHQQRREAIATLNDKTWHRITANRWAAFTDDEIDAILHGINATNGDIHNDYALAREAAAELERRKA